MRIAYLTAEGRDRIDLLVAEAVARLEARGYRLGGAVATALSRRFGQGGPVTLRVLPDGPVVPLSERLAGGADRLDVAALADAAVQAERHLDGVRGFVLNRFGRLEAQGRGFAPVLSAARARGLPILVGVPQRYLPDFRLFAGDTAEALPDHAARAADWLLGQVAAAA